MRQPYGREIASTITYFHPEWWASKGYMVIIQDVRGMGSSEGDFNSKGISASSDKAIEYVSNKKKLTAVNAEIFSIYVIGLHCPDII